MGPLLIAIFLCLYTVIDVGGFGVAALGEIETMTSQAFSGPTAGSVHKDTPILFVGDVMLARDVERKSLWLGDEYPHQHMLELYDTHTIQVGNFEGSVPEIHRSTPDMHFAFSVPVTALPSLGTVGFTHFSLANNHSYDFGRDGFAHTRVQLQEAGMHSFGDPYELREDSFTLIERQGSTLALIGLDLTVSDYEMNALDALFLRAREQSDLQIVYVHWGTEYQRSHSAVQEQWAEYFIDQGTDLVIGHHPHVVQDIQMHDGVPVFYSLGNFIFDQYFSRDVQEGLVLSVDMDARRIELVPVSTEHTPIAPKQMTGTERVRFLRDLSQRSDKALVESILQGEVLF